MKCFIGWLVILFFVILSPFQENKNAVSPPNDKQMKYKTVLFSGHMQKPVKGNSKGAMSCTGVLEYIYNDNIFKR